MIGAARSLPLEAAARRSERVETADPAGLLSPREATLRSAATTCLAGIALVQAIGLPPLFAQGRQLAALSIAAMGLCLILGWGLAAAPASAAAALWRSVAATSALVLTGWAVSHAFAVPGLAGDQGDWASMPGLVTAVLAVACIGVAISAAPPTRASLRGLAVALAVTLAFTPAVAVVLVALGPGTAGGETVLASGAHIHSHGSPESAIIYQADPGGHGGRYVYKATATPHQTPIEIGLIVTATFLFTFGAVLYLRARSSAPSESPAPAGAMEGLA